MVSLIKRTCLVLCLWLPIQVVAADIVVVVNKSNPVAQMTRSEVIGLFMGKYAAFSTGKRAVSLDLIDSHPARAIFYQKLVGRSVASINAYWSRIRFSGKRRPPIQKTGYSEIISALNSDQQAISYLPRSMVSEQMKVVFELD